MKVIPYQISFDKTTGVMRVELHGVITVEDTLRAVDAISEEDRFVSGRRLWNLRRCQLDLTSDDLRKIGETGKSRDAGKSRLALLVKRDLHFGLSRVLQAYRETNDLEVMVFRNEPDALAWLTADEQ